MKTTESNPEKMKNNFDDDDTRRVADTTHALKGSAATILLEDIAEVAKGIEENGLNSLENTDSAIKRIEAQCDRIA